MTIATASRPAVDATLGEAADIARAVAEDMAGPSAQVGQHLGADAEGDRLVTHRFGCTDPAYGGWHWAVTLSRVPRSKAVTVCEVVLLPGDDAVMAAEWLPWADRLAPGDLGVGDLMATAPDDDRLEPGYTATADDDADADADADDADRVALWELGLGRARVLSPIGRDDAVDRWYSGAHGPEAPIAAAAPAPCSTCGFVAALGGSLRQVFGVCTNEYSPSDGQVVSYDHGCGAHSEVALLPAAVEIAPPVIDEEGFDLVTLPADEETS